MRRLSNVLKNRVQSLLRVGFAVRCPICRWRFRHFRLCPTESGYVEQVCWRCWSRERHRAVWMYLNRHPELLRGTTSLLHFAPEWQLARRFRSVPGLGYRSADIEPGRADLCVDITDMDLPDASYEAVICSHVLEHVSDDRQAMREVMRVLRPGGWALVMFPIDSSRDHTHEDPTMTTPEDRRREFWQHDHLRLYGRDAAIRLAESGAAVETAQAGTEFGLPAVRRHGLADDELIFLCRKPASTPESSESHLPSP